MPHQDRGFLHRVLNMDVAEFSRILTAAGFRELRVREMHFWPARLALGYIPWPRWITAPAVKTVCGLYLTVITAWIWGKAIGP